MGQDGALGQQPPPDLHRVPGARGCAGQHRPCGRGACGVPGGHAHRLAPDRSGRLVRGRDCATGHEERVNAGRSQTSQRNAVGPFDLAEGHPASGDLPSQDLRTRAEVVQVNRIGSAGHGVGKVPAGQYIVERQGVIAHDVSRLPCADLRRGVQQPRLLEAGHMTAQELQYLEHLLLGLDLGPAERDGVGSVDPVDPRCVDRDHARNRTGLNADPVAGDRQLTGRAGTRNEVGKGIDHHGRRVQVLRHVVLAVPSGRDPHLLGMRPQVSQHRRHIHARDAKDPRGRLHRGVRLPAEDKPRSRPRSDVGVSRSVHDGTRAQQLKTGLVGDRDPADARAVHQGIDAEGVQQELHRGLEQHRQQDVLQGRRIGHGDRADLLVGPVWERGAARDEPVEQLRAYAAQRPPPSPITDTEEGHAGSGHAADPAGLLNQEGARPGPRRGNGGNGPRGSGAADDNVDLGARAHRRSYSSLSGVGPNRRSRSGGCPPCCRGFCWFASTATTSS
jgi:hypothetical protein